MSKSAQAAVAISQAVDADEVVGGIEAEVPDDAALSALADEKLDGDAVARTEKSAGDTMLSRYFREMAGHRVLTPQEVVQANSCLFSRETNWMPLALAKFCPRKWEVPAWMALRSCTMASTVKVFSAPGKRSRAVFSPGMTGIARWFVRKSS